MILYFVNKTCRVSGSIVMGIMKIRCKVFVINFLNVSRNYKRLSITLIINIYKVHKINLIVRHSIKLSVI